MAVSSMRRNMPSSDTRTTPEIGSGGHGVPLTFDFRTDDEHIEIVYAALRKAVEVYDFKQGSFADDMGKPLGDVSQRLNRAVHKGQLQRAHIDFIGFLGKRPAARVVFLRELAKAWRCRVEEERPLTDAETVRLLASELSDKRKREIEREQGLAPGVLG